MSLIALNSELLLWKLVWSLFERVLQSLSMNILSRLSHALFTYQTADYACVLQQRSGIQDVAAKKKSALFTSSHLKLLQQLTLLSFRRAVLRESSFFSSMLSSDYVLMFLQFA